MESPIEAPNALLILLEGVGLSYTPAHGGVGLPKRFCLVDDLKRTPKDAIHLIDGHPCGDVFAFGVLLLEGFLNAQQYLVDHGRRYQVHTIVGFDRAHHELLRVTTFRFPFGGAHLSELRTSVSPGRSTSHARVRQ